MRAIADYHAKTYAGVGLADLNMGDRSIEASMENGCGIRWLRVGLATRWALICKDGLMLMRQHDHPPMMEGNAAS